MIVKKIKLFVIFSLVLSLVGSCNREEKNEEDGLEAKLVYPAPTYGENMYQYRMSAQGWSDKAKTGEKTDVDRYKTLPILKY